jgi:uroporphyrinogen decarboxylase
MTGSKTPIHIPLNRPKPDAHGFIAGLLGHGGKGRVPLVEYIVDEVVMRPIVEGLLGRRWAAVGNDRDSQRAYLDNVIDFWYRMGYDFVRFEQGLPLPERMQVIADAAPQSDKDRAWPDEHHGAVTSWDDFERYPWPKVEEFDFFPFEYLSRHLPEGMGLITSHGGGVFEHLSWIMSFEGLCSALFDDPALVRAIADRLGDLMTKFYRHILGLDNLIAVFPGDDMGYRSATMISPDALRKIVLPWHKRFASMAHERGLPYFLHSCGRITAIMEDLINDVGIDGKHSYEDAIMPVQDFQMQYGHRTAVLGGLDINILSGATAEEVRTHVRFLVETCGPRGRYAIGSGNSVPSYVPVENYLTMIDEAHRCAAAAATH